MQVLAHRDRFKMIGVDAMANTTKMVDGQPLGDRSSVKLPSDSVGERTTSVLATDTDLAVAIGHSSACPQPVSVLALNLLLKAIPDWSALTLIDAFRHGNSIGSL